MAHGRWLSIGVLVSALAATPVRAQSILVVSLGDSSASGEGNPDGESRFGKFVRWEGTTFDGVDDDADAQLAHFDGICHRSRWSGHRQAADAFGGASPVPFEFKSFACTGAKIEELAGKWQHDEWNDLTEDVMPQLEQVAGRYAGRRIDALLINAGINDMGFAGALGECIASPDCVATEDRAATDAKLDALAASYDGLEQKIVDLGLDVANVYLVGYPDGTTGPGGASCDGVPDQIDELDAIAANESARASEILQRLNLRIRAAAEKPRRQAWHYVGGVEEAFRDGHGFCAGGDRWIRTFSDSRNVQGWINGAMHPNHSGHAAYARAIEPRLHELLPPPTPTFGTVGDADKALRIVAEEKAIRLRWKASPDATWVQIGFRPSIYVPSGPIYDQPPPASPDVLADPPWMTKGWDIGWQYLPLVPAGNGGYVHNVTGVTLDYAIRACTPAACSPWSRAEQVSNVLPAAPVGLVALAVGAAAIQMGWTHGLASDPYRGAYQVAWRYRDQAWRYETIGAGYTRYAFAVTMGDFDFAVRACARAICSGWVRTQLSNQVPVAPSQVAVVGPWSDFWVVSYGWSDYANNETAYQLVLYVNGGYQVVNLASNTTSKVLGSRYYAWVRACANKGCSDFQGTQSPTTDILVPVITRYYTFYVAPPTPTGIAPPPGSSYSWPSVSPSTAWPM